MAWQWVNDLLSSDGRKKFYWDARCPYQLCPSNQPFRGAGKSRLKFIQIIAFFTYQYKCKDCGNLTNFSIEQPDPQRENYKDSLQRLNPALADGRPDYTFHV